MRIYYRQNAILLADNPVPFVAGTLTARLNTAAGTIEICRVDSAFTLANPNWADVADENGNTFATPDAALGYLAAQFAMRRPLSATYVQATPASVWRIAHGLGFNPAVMLEDTAGDPFMGDTRHPDINTVTITFASPASGTAFLS